MTYDEFDAFCASLPATNFVEQWGGAHVWKIGPKMFAVGGWDAGPPAFTFKVTPLAFEVMKSASGMRPAPYLASRGMKWLQRFDETSVCDEDLRGYLRGSHALVGAGLPRRVQQTLGLASLHAARRRRV